MGPVDVNVLQLNSSALIQYEQLIREENRKLEGELYSFADLDWDELPCVSNQGWLIN